MMTVDELKDYLRSIRKKDAEIDRMLDKIHSLEADATRITARYGGEAVKHSRNNHAMEDTIVRKIDMEHEVNAEIDKLIDMKQHARELFDRLSRPEYTRVMTLHYLEYLSWSKIAETTGFAPSSTKRWHVEALNEIVKFS